MTEILCNWLNNEAKVSKRIENQQFANDFASGYLFGELLNKYGLQDDFDQFTPTTIEPTIHLLDIPFDTQVARDIMDAKPGAAAKLVYELFISLTKKEKAGLTGTALEAMRPKAPAKLHMLAGQVYRDEMHRKVPRESTLQLERISQTYSDRQKNFEAFKFKERLEEDENRRNAVAEAREKEAVDRKRRQALQAELFARLRAAKYDVSDFVPSRSQLSDGERANIRRLRELRSAMKQIDEFEKRLEETRPIVALSDAELIAYVKRTQQLQEMGLDSDDLLVLESDLEGGHGKKTISDNISDYMTRIKRRLNEERAARVEREKRRRKVLLDQLRAREQQEEEKREQLLLSRLLRRSQQERRISAQLLAIRKEKEGVRENRLAVQKKFAEAREAEFRATLEQNAAMARLKLAEDESVLAEAKRTHELLLAERAKAKFAEYREMTNKKPVPVGLFDEWKRLLVAGLPLYESPLSDIPDDEVKAISEIVPPQLLSADAIKLLDRLDFSDYLTASGIWKDEENSILVSIPDLPVEKQPINKILLHVTGKLVQSAYPPPPKPEIEELPKVRCLVTLCGKPYSGTTTISRELANDERVRLISLSDLVDGAFKFSEIPEYELFPPPNPEAEPELEVLNDDIKTEGSEHIQNLPAGEEGEKTPEPTQQIELKPEEVPKQEAAEKSENSEEKPPSEGQGENLIPEHESSVALIDETLVLKRKRYDLAVKLSSLIKSGDAIPAEILAQLVVDELRAIPDDEAHGQITIISDFPTTLNELRVFQAIVNGLDSIEVSPSQLPPRPKFVDLALLLDCPDEVCLNRKVTALQDDQLSNVSAQGLEQRLVWFSERWPEIEEYFIKNNVPIQPINAVHSIEEVTTAAIWAIENRISELEAPPPEPEIPPPPPEPEPVPVIDQPPQPPPEPTPPPAPPAKKGRGRSPTKGDKSAKKGGKSASPNKSPKSGRKGKKTPTPEPPPAPEVPPEPPGPTPDQPEWVIIDKPISEEITIVLADIWQSAVQTYGGDCQKALRGIRLERDQLIRFLFRIRIDLALFLKQPDTKRDFVAVFCRDFNFAISGEMKNVDEESRAELHQRCDDLRDRLWSICENKRSVAEKRRMDISTSGWLEERVGLVLNHLIRLMQAEIDRFHSGVCLLRDYYRAIESPMPDNFVPQSTKLPLYQLPSEESLLAELSNESATPNPVEQQPSQSQMSTNAPSGRPDSRNRSKKSRSPKPSTEPEPTQTSLAANAAGLVNLEIIPRRPRDLQPTMPQLPDSMAGDKKRRPSAGKKQDKKGKGKDPLNALIDARKVEPPVQLPSDLELRLLFDSWWGAYGYIHNLCTLEQALTEKERETSEEARVQMLTERVAAAGVAAAEREKEREKEKKKAKVKGRSPSPKKNRTPSPKPPADLDSAETEDEKEKRRLKEAMRQEFLYAVDADEKATGHRLEMIRNTGQLLIEEMKRASSTTLNSMSEMAGQRFLVEMTAVDQLLAYIRNCIEHANPLDADLVLDGDNFWALFADEKTQSEKVPKITPLIAQIQAMESLAATAAQSETSSAPDVPVQFSFQQLNNLHKQFVRFAPSGVMEIRAFEELFRDFGSDLFVSSSSIPLGGPAGTKRQLLSASAVSELAQLIAIDGDFADWRLLLLCLAHPWPIPSRSDIISMLIRFRDMDQRRLGSLSRPQYNRVEMWFSGSPVEQAFTEKDMNTLKRPPSANDVVWRGGAATAQSIPQVRSAPEAHENDSRLQQFREFLFDIFAENIQPRHGDLPPHLQQPRIDYVTMLSYVARVSDGSESLVKMLALALGDYIANRSKSGRPETLKGQREPWQTTVLRQASDSGRDDLMIPLEPLYRVLSTHIRMRASHSRVGDAAAKEERVLKEKLQGVFAELNSGRALDDPISLGTLSKQAVTEEILSSASANFKAPQPKAVFKIFQEIQEKEQ